MKNKFKILSILSVGTILPLSIISCKQNKTIESGTPEEKPTEPSKPETKVKELKITELKVKSENNKNVLEILISNKEINNKKIKDILSSIKLKIQHNESFLSPSSFNENTMVLIFDISNISKNKENKIEYLEIDEKKITTELSFSVKEDKDLKTPPSNEPNDPIQPQPGPQPPEFPGLPPGFTFPSFDRTNLHTYPNFVNEFTKVDKEVIYNEIFDRTFAIKFGVGKKTGDENYFLSTDSGTAWLLDYYKKDENNYKLFFATNLHVASMLSNTLEDNIAQSLNYNDPRDLKAKSISLGKAKGTYDQIKTSRNNTEVPNNFKGTEQYHAKWWSSDEKFKDANLSGTSASITTKTEGISAPKLIFAGYDFIKREFINPLQEDLKRKAREYLNNQRNNGSVAADDDEDSEDKVIKRAIDSNEFIPIYTDFAVFEIEINMTNMDNSLKELFKKSITALDNYLKRLKDTNKLPNQDKNISSFMQTTDYFSAAKEKNNPTRNNLWNAQNLYIGGYPSSNNGSVWSVNNPTERYDESIQWYPREPKNAKAFSFATSQGEERITNSNVSPYGKAQGKLLGDYYGYNYSLLFSSLYYGASGSLVYNEFGQMVGIYNTVSANVENGDLSKNAGFAPFLLSEDVQGNIPIKAYNLIDGTDKNRFPAQTASYRENSAKIYPNGFNDNNFKTALFPEGFKK
ncbi:MIP family Ig-specific serine endopeptidase [Mycoplasmopsis felis]|uniref:MIP family Ig-specific serine endopeptidase n=1 Tax=Mycoplasmopsis felis TaxID=33923 RepID=UPI002AFDF914|nr:DUF31 family protein [Mycoplasmopsis felis]WQQ08008.1 DUF31 family protein [Mycoplasmopsis felis]